MNQNQEPKYLDIDFIIDEEKYNYNFDKLNANQIYAGRTYFHIMLELHEKLPASPEEVEIITKRLIQKHAFASIINKEDKNTGKFIKYNQTSPVCFNFLDDLYGADNFQKLEEIKTDFFYHTGLFNKELTMGLPDLMKQLQTLSETERQQIFKAAIQLGDSNSSTKKGRNTTTHRNTKIK